MAVILSRILTLLILAIIVEPAHAVLEPAQALLCQKVANPIENERVYNRIVELAGIHGRTWKSDVKSPLNDKKWRPYDVIALANVLAKYPDRVEQNFNFFMNFNQTCNDVLPTAPVAYQVGLFAVLLAKQTTVDDFLDIARFMKVELTLTVPRPGGGTARVKVEDRVFLRLIAITLLLPDNGPGVVVDEFARLHEENLKRDKKLDRYELAGELYLRLQSHLTGNPAKPLEF